MHAPIHLRPASTYIEQWLQIHVRRLHVHTFHHHTLSVSDDGRIALATGPYLNILHPPSFPPFHPTLNPPLRLVFSGEVDTSSSRKDTLSTTCHLTSIVWVCHALMLLDGSAALTLLRAPPNPDTSNFSLDTTSHFWHPSPLFLPSQNSTPSLYHLRQTNVRCFDFARVCHISDKRKDSLTLSTFLVCGTDSGTEFYPLDLDSSTSKFSPLDPTPITIHSVCTVSIACVDGVQDHSGIRTVVAVADSSGGILVYTVALKISSDAYDLETSCVWKSSASLPPGPVISLSWSIHSARDSILTLAAAIGNDVIVVDWASSASSFLTSSEWDSPDIRCVRDAHEHVVTAVQVCYDGCVVSAGMDGRVICWRLDRTLPASCADITSLGIVAFVLQDRTDNNEPVMALERTNNAFALVSVTSTSRQGQEVCDSDVMRKYTGTARRTMMRVLVLPPYGSADDAELAVISCAERLMNHPSLVDRPITTWDAAHFLHSFLDCASAVVPRLGIRLVDMMKDFEDSSDQGTQRFVQRARALLWLARVVNHPHGSNTDTRTSVDDISRRLRNSLLFVQYVHSLKRFESLGYKQRETSRDERVSLDHMCQFVSTWQVKGWEEGESGMQLVREVRGWLELFVADGENLMATCSVCACSGSEAPLMADGMDPGTMWCTGGHSFTRCVSTGLPVTCAVSVECAGCNARCITIEEGSFDWVHERGQCGLCKGGLVGSHCQAG